MQKPRSIARRPLVPISAIADPRQPRLPQNLGILRLLVGTPTMPAIPQNLPPDSLPSFVIRHSGFVIPPNPTAYFPLTPPIAETP
jgi:hypothetical protein